MTFLAAAGSVDTTNPLVAYGLLGIILVAVVALWLSGRMVSGREYDRVLLINDRLSTDNAAMTNRLIDSADNRIANTQALKETTAVLRDVLVVLEVNKRAGP